MIEVVKLPNKQKYKVDLNNHENFFYKYLKSICDE